MWPETSPLESAAIGKSTGGGTPFFCGSLTSSTPLSQPLFLAGQMPSMTGMLPWIQNVTKLRQSSWQGFELVELRFRCDMGCDFRIIVIFPHCDRNCN